MRTHYIVLCGYVTGGGHYPLTIDYSWDGKLFGDREQAIRHGMTMGRSDDFNIGVMEGGKLASLDWMNDVIDRDPDVLAEIAESACLDDPVFEQAEG